jgi:hypothetical protein
VTFHSFLDFHNVSISFCLSLHLFRSPSVPLSCIRILSKEINSFVLPPLAQWLELHPQQENETGIERIEKIARYKSLLFLFSKVTSQGLKITKSFGLLFFRYSDCWSMIESGLLSRSQSAIPQDDLQLFQSIISQFSSSLSGHRPVVAASLPTGALTESVRESSTVTSSRVDSTSSVPVLESTIIWCPKIEVELQKRQELRIQQAKQREREYQEELRGEIERLRDEGEDEDEESENAPRVEEIE